MASSEGLSSTIKTSEEFTADEDVQLFCNFCLVERSKYTCPRCNARYCSLGCYKSERHLQCSEEFYKESVISDLRLTERSPEEKRQMMDLLRKFESENAPPLLEADSLTLEERLAGLDIDRDGEEIWQRLTPEERKEFDGMIKSGTAGGLLEPHTPWWETIPRVVPLTPTDSSKLPQVPADLPPLKTLVKDPSPCVVYSVFNALLAYAYVVRLFHGGHRDLPLQACQAVLELALCLSRGAVFTSIHETLTSSLSLIQQNHDLFNSREFSLVALEDVVCILGNKKAHDCHVTRALADLHALMKLAHKHIKSAKTGEEAEARTLWQAKKKVYFLLVWSSENMEVLYSQRPVLELELGAFQLEESSSPMGETKSHACKQLIEEL